MERVKDSEIVPKSNYTWARLAVYKNLIMTSAKAGYLVAIVDELWCFVLHTYVRFNKSPNTFIVHVVPDNIALVGLLHSY